MLNYPFEKYPNCGSFTFRPTEKLQDKCNAPTNMGGIYLIYKIVMESEVLIYIGSSGRKIDGKLKVRESGLGGMKDRLVNGHHPKFGKVPRKRTFPVEMVRQGISEIKVYWWVTYEGRLGCSDFPTDVEAELRHTYLDQFDQLPEWHK